MSSEIVFIQNDKVVTDSLMVAEVFKKDHDKVIRDIKKQLSKLIEAGESEFSTANFGESEYINDRGRKYNKFILTEEAFTLVTMSYITVEAMKFKVKYISEFNRLRQLLGSRNTKLPSSFAEALRLAADLEEEKERLEAENKVLLPKAQIHDQIADAKNLSSVKKVGKNIGVGEKKFFEFLRASKIFYREGASNLPYQNYQNQGYFDVKISTNSDKDGNIFNTYITKVTGSGELFILNIVNKYGGADKINKLKLTEIKDYITTYDFKPSVLQLEEGGK